MPLHMLLESSIESVWEVLMKSFCPRNEDNLLKNKKPSFPLLLFCY
ncbi:hypothetical protein CUMW_057040 [Citrus unshiu]|nr:hypothetical protein CUMW_057040 [Citrus unshiu]GAY41124.1 hypothetical protein CUMW_057040 [Citrus unshiu]